MADNSVAVMRCKTTLFAYVVKF